MTPEQQRILGLARQRLAEAQAASVQPRGSGVDQSHASGLFDQYTQGATLEWGDELTGHEAGMLGRHPDGRWFDYGDSTYDERFLAARDAERQQQDAYRDENPTKAAIANLAGALSTTGGAAKRGLTLMRGGLTGGQVLSRGAAEGAGYAVTEAAGASDEAIDNPTDLAVPAIVGGVTGVAGSALASQLSRMLTDRNISRAAPTVGSVRKMADAAYKRARDIDPKFEGFDDWVMNAYRAMPDQGYHNKLHPQMSAVMDRIEELSRGGTAPTLKQLEQLRRLMGTPAQMFQNPDQQRLAKILRGSLDEFMEGAADRVPGNQLVPADMTIIGTPQREALDQIREGRRLYRMAKKGELVEGLIEKAEDRAGSTYSGGNIENALRQNLRKILDSNKLSATFTKAEQEALREAIRGDTVRNVTRFIAKLSPARGGLMALLVTGGTSAGLVTAGPAALIPAGVASIADVMARAGMRSRATAVKAQVLGVPNAVERASRIRPNPATTAIINALSANAGGATQ